MEICIIYEKLPLHAKKFDPFFLIDANIHTLELLADGLHHFQYNNLFTVEFISNLKCELPLAKKHDEATFDWTSIKHSNQNKTSLDNRIKRRSRNDTNGNQIHSSPSDTNWKNDPGESALKIWGWWKLRIVNGMNNFPFMSHALRLVVLTQVSSCAVEGVFLSSNNCAIHAVIQYYRIC